MNSVLVFCFFGFISVSFAEIIPSDEGEKKAIEDLISVMELESVPCDYFAEDSLFFCCSSNEYLQFFHDLMGFKNVTICDVYKDVCARRQCQNEILTACQPDCTQWNEEWQEYFGEDNSDEFENEENPEEVIETTEKKKRRSLKLNKRSLKPLAKLIKRKLNKTDK